MAYLRRKVFISYFHADQDEVGGAAVRRQNRRLPRFVLARLPDK